jgi:hypothetical protein
VVAPDVVELHAPPAQVDGPHSVHHLVGNDHVGMPEGLQSRLGVPVGDERGAAVFEGLATRDVVVVMMAVAAYRTGETEG